MRDLGTFGSFATPMTLAQGRGDGMMGDWGFGFGMGLWWVFWIALLVLVVVAIWRLLQGGGSAAARAQDDSALEILKRRYARGEIDREEYEAKKRDLDQS